MSKKQRKSSLSRKPKAIAQLACIDEFKKIPTPTNAKDVISKMKINLSSDTIEELFVCLNEYARDLLYQDSAQKRLNIINLREKDRNKLRRFYKLNKKLLSLHVEISCDSEYRDIMPEIDAWIRISSSICDSLNGGITYNKIIDQALTKFFNQPEIKVVSAKKFKPHKTEGSVPDARTIYINKLVKILKKENIRIKITKKENIRIKITKNDDPPAGYEKQPIFLIMDYLEQFLPSEMPKTNHTCASRSQELYRALKA